MQSVVYSFRFTNKEVRVGKNIAERALQRQATMSRVSALLDQLNGHVKVTRGISFSEKLWMEGPLAEIMSDLQLIEVFDRCKTAGVSLVIDSDELRDLSEDGKCVFIGLKAKFEDIRKFLLGQ